MTYEEAYYFEILLSLGITEGYEEWLNNYLEIENPISDVVLELSFNTVDIPKSISILSNFRYNRERKIDEKAVCENLRLYLKDKYKSKSADEKEISILMYRMANIIGDPESFNCKIWNSFYYMSDYCSLAENHNISFEQFKKAFYDYLIDGKDLNMNFYKN